MKCPVDPGDFSSPDLPHRFQVDVAAWKAAKSMANGPQRWHEWAGSLAAHMMLSRHYTASGLEHPATLVRRTAAALVVDYWNADDQVFAPGCYELAFHDSDAVVRGAAFNAVARLIDHYADATGCLHALIREVFGDASMDDFRALYTALDEVEGMLTCAHSEAVSRLLSGAARMASGYCRDMSREGFCALEYIAHDDPGVRKAALMVLLSQGAMNNERHSECFRRIVTQDEDEEVRYYALAVLLQSKTPTDDRELGSMLANVVSDAGLGDNLRKLAYLGLYLVRRMPLEYRPDVTSDEFKVDRDINWEFVRSFCTPQ